jgi:hypothetical protein
LAARLHGGHQHDRGRQTLPPPSFVERSLLAQQVESTRFRIGVNIDSDDGGTLMSGQKWNGSTWLENWDKLSSVRMSEVPERASGCGVLAVFGPE